MTKSDSVVRRTQRLNVTTPTRHRTVRAALVMTTLASVVTGCGSNDPVMATNVASNDLSPVDAGNADSGSVPSPAEQLCALTGPPAAAKGEVLVFGDDFAGNAVDTKKWNLANGSKRDGTILNTFSPKNAEVHDDSLFIASDRSAAGAEKPYVGGFMDTLGKYARTYGRVEFRARFPYTPGVWYAIWATPVSQPFPEIDVEITNMAAAQLWFVNHWAAPPLPADARRAYFVAPKDVKKPTDGVDLDQFHTYSMLWKPGLLELSLDGAVKLQRTTVGVPDLPMYWRINSWVGGWVGAPTAATQLPVSFEVDYFRVYRVDGLIADPSIWITNKKSRYTKSDVIHAAVADFDEACTHVEMFDGATRVKTTSTSPFRFSLSSLKAGKHTLSFVATDGTRSTVASVDALID